jgi:hypothetical protein
MRSLLERALKYYLLPGRPPIGFSHQPLYDEAYRFWKRFWTDVLSKNGTSEKLNGDDFRRQDCIAVLVHQERIVALMGYTFFDLGSAADREHSYFRHFYTPKAIAALEALHVRRVMTVEYFSVDPEWRAGRLGVSLGAVMGELALRFAASQGVDAALGVVRSDNGVAYLARQLGGAMLDENIRIYETPCDLAAFLPANVRRFPSPQINRLTDQFWQNRIDIRSLVPRQSPNRRKEAA